MDGEQEAARGRGQVLASLRASEGVIYERFGFGVAGESRRFEVQHLVPVGPAVEFAEDSGHLGHDAGPIQGLHS